MHKSKLPSIKTKIVCTIGPSTREPAVLEEMIANGMSVARLNFAHGDFEDHREMVENIRAAARACGRRVAIMGDLPGPKMRIGRLIEEPIKLKRGQDFILQTDEIEGDHERVSLSFKELPQVVKPGDRIYLNDGFILLEVKKVTGQDVHCTVLVGDELRSFKGVNFPGIDLGVKAFTERDLECLRFAGEVCLDAVSQSFVQSPQDMEEVRKAAADMAYYPFLIAKIERSKAVENLEGILECSDGIMVARGDLGVEIPIEEIAVTQKHMIKMANLYGRPVIVATQMLESMVHHTRPTRAEATDVANAILVGADCVMLCGETANGDFPVEAVNVMACIASVTEGNAVGCEVPKLLNNASSGGEISRRDLISLTINFSIKTLNPSIVLTPTLSGSTPRGVSRFRPPAWIVAVSPNESTCQNLQFSYGVYPVHETKKPGKWELYTRDWMERNYPDGDIVLLTEGTGTAGVGGTNKLEIIDLKIPPAESAVW